MPEPGCQKLAGMPEDAQGTPEPGCRRMLKGHRDAGGCSKHAGAGVPEDPGGSPGSQRMLGACRSRGAGGCWRLAGAAGTAGLEEAGGPCGCAGARRCWRDPWSWRTPAPGRRWSQGLALPLQGPILPAPPPPTAPRGARTPEEGPGDVSPAPGDTDTYPGPGMLEAGGAGWGRRRGGHWGPPIAASPGRPGPEGTAAALGVTADATQLLHPSVPCCPQCHCHRPQRPARRRGVKKRFF